MVSAGHTLVGKRELPGGFGAPSMEANRALLGDDWKLQASAAEEWEVEDADLVVGNPPCSGFSVLSSPHWRGMDSPANACMHAFIEYVARVRPQAAAFESVQIAFTRGLPLMRLLHEKLEALTGIEWHLTHVLQNAYNLGGAAVRKRYFFVVSRVPLAVTPPEPVANPPLLQDVIGDLCGLQLTWERQVYRRPASGWAQHLRSRTGAVDGHSNRSTSGLRRAIELMDGVDWPEGEEIGNVARAYHEAHGRMPPSWSDEYSAKTVANGFRFGFYCEHRWHMDRPCRVVTGGATDLILHPLEPRALTNREAARIQGFPDDWRISPLQKERGVGTWWGKGIPVECGRWLGRQLTSTLEGERGLATGCAVGERERLIDVTDKRRMVLTDVDSTRVRAHVARVAAAGVNRQVRADVPPTEDAGGVDHAAAAAATA